MNRLKNTLRATLLCVAAFTSIPALGEVKVGDSITLPQLEDQFEATQVFQDSTKWLLFAHDMDSTNIIRDALEGQTEESLGTLGIQFFADISGMPGLISRFIAMPRLKKLAYPIALARDEKQLASIPREDNKATLLQIEQGEVKLVTIVDTTEKLKALIGLQ